MRMHRLALQPASAAIGMWPWAGVVGSVTIERDV